MKDWVLDKDYIRFLGTSNQFFYDYYKHVYDLEGLWSMIVNTYVNS